MDSFEVSEQFKLIRMLSFVDRAHRARIEAEAARFGLHRSQHMMLMFLSRHVGENFSQKEIADRFEISPAAVATTLKKLENAGLVGRQTNAEDARFNQIDLTDKGREIVSKTKILFRQIDEEMFKDLTQEEMQNLSATLAKLVQALKKNTPSCCAGEEEGKSFR